MNNKDQIVGNLKSGDAFLWTKGVIKDLGNLTNNCIGCDNTSTATSINYNGQVVGYSSECDANCDRTENPVYWNAFVYQNGIMTNLQVSGVANDINNSAKMIGVNDSGTQGGDVPQDAIIFNPYLSFLPVGNLHDEQNYALAINNKGDIVGSYYDNNSSASVRTAFLYKNGKVINLPGTYATSINDNDWIIIDSSLWENGKLVSLSPFVPSNSINGYFTSSAKAINRVNQIAGSYNNQAAIWSKGKIIQLTGLSSNPSKGISINDNSDVVGMSQDASGSAHMVLWTYK